MDPTVVFLVIRDLRDRKDSSSAPYSEMPILMKPDCHSTERFCEALACETAECEVGK